MKTETPEKAACSKQAAGKNESHNKLYQKAAPLSSLKMRIGELLLYLQNPLTQNKQQDCWQRFDHLLRQYVSLRHLGDAL